MSRTVFDGWLTTGWTGEPRETWLGCGPDGSVAGWYLLEVPDRDNRHLGILEAFVDPARRRQGFGTALLRHAAERALADGRRLLTGAAIQDSPGDSFARSLGATAGQAEIRRRLDLAAMPAGLVAGLRASAVRPPGHGLRGPGRRRAPGRSGRSVAEVPAARVLAAGPVARS